MQNGLAIASLLLLSSTGLSAAADLSAPIIGNDSLETTSSWQGTYVGVQGGWAWVTAHDNSSFPSTDVDGGSIGAFIGYNHTFEQLVFGMELDASYFNIEKTTSSSTIRSNWSAGLSGRIGYAFDTFMPYARVGLGLQDGYMKGLGSGRSDSNIHAYGEFGLGLEMKLTDNTSLRGEVLRRASDKQTYQLNNDYEGHFDNTLGRVGLSYQF